MKLALVALALFSIAHSIESNATSSEIYVERELTDYYSAPECRGSVTISSANTTASAPTTSEFQSQVSISKWQIPHAKLGLEGMLFPSFWSQAFKCIWKGEPCTKFNLHIYNALGRDEEIFTELPESYAKPIDFEKFKISIQKFSVDHTTKNIRATFSIKNGEQSASIVCP